MPNAKCSTQSSPSQLGHGDRRVPVEHGGVAQQGDVQPAAPPLPSRRHTELLPVTLQELAHFLELQQYGKAIK